MNKIQDLKRTKDVTILAHYYQRPEIHQIADFIGDSLELAKAAKSQLQTRNIIFAGVRFMAETAAILNPQKGIYLPELDAGCPLADYLNENIMTKWRQQYLYSPIVVYINTNAETKANADVCCTSSNAIKIVSAIAKEWNTDTILFGPDKNLATWVETKTKLKIIKIPGIGNCPYHNDFSLNDVENARKNHPYAKLLVHPESPIKILNKADFVGSTSAMVKYIEEHPQLEGFILGTENGLIDFIRQKYPNVKVFPLSKNANCLDMKKITLSSIEKTLDLIEGSNDKLLKIHIPEDLALKAQMSINKMLELSN